MYVHTPIQNFEMEMHLKMKSISGMPSNTNNTASTLVKPTKIVYKVILCLSIITVKAFSVSLVISGKLL
jgi:hypothetical protein